MLFSVGKLFWLAVILWAVWMVFRVIEKRRNQGPAAPKADQQQPQDELEMTQCNACGAFVSRAGCNKPDCPVAK